MIKVLSVQDMWDEDIVAIAAYKAVHCFEGQADIPYNIMRSFVKYLLSLDSCPSTLHGEAKRWWIDLKEEAEENLYMEKGEKAL